MVTTTETTRQSAPVRCEVCGREARGGVLIDGRGECHVRAGDRALLVAMIGDAPAPEPALPPLIAADPMKPERGAHPGALAILGKVRERARRGDPDARQASGQAVKAVLDESGQTFGIDGSPWKHAPDGSRWVEQEPLHGPSIPPPPGAPDPAMDDLVRSGATNGYSIRKRRRC